jgi:hypothetical protein
MHRLDIGILAVVIALLGGCYTPWYSQEDNPSACTRDQLPTGACGAEGTVCRYTENTGNSVRPQDIQRCTCSAGAWACQSDFLRIDSGNDAGGE